MTRSGTLHCLRTCALVLVFLAAGLGAQTEGPLKVKIPPRRPPTMEPPPERQEPRREEDRPVLRRAPRSEAGEASGACPEGYIPKPRTEDERPRLTRNPDSQTKSVDQGVECVRVDAETLDKGHSSSGTYAFSGTYSNGMDSQLAAAVNVVAEFADRLPNYICDQVTDRYKSGVRPPRWKKDDTIENDLLFIDGRESYREFRRNGKKLKDMSPMTTGDWSTGEWGTMVQNIFSEDTAAQFEFVREEDLDGVATRLYDFKVKQERSDWRLMFEAESIYPAFHGSIWIEAETQAVRRLEYIADDLPVTYPKDIVETTVDFGPVEMGGEDHMVAIRSETLACRRWKESCTKNTSHYRNYRLFSTESTVMQTESTVTFEGEEDAQDEKKP